MQNEPSTGSAAAVTVNELAARVATLERSGRRWRFAFAALALIVVGVAADEAKEASKVGEFDIVKAKSFEVIGSEGVAIGSLGVRKDVETGIEKSYLLVTSEKKKKATIVYPGEDLTIVERTKGDR